VRDPVSKTKVGRDRKYKYHPLAFLHRKRGEGLGGEGRGEGLGGEGRGGEGRGVEGREVVHQSQAWSGVRIYSEGQGQRITSSRPVWATG
jgi:hypothetical protein